MLFTVGLACLVAFVGMLLLGSFVGHVIRLGNDADAPEHVSRRDWERVREDRRSSW